MTYRSVKCYYCGQEMDRNVMDESEWLQLPSKRYAHTSCHNAHTQEQELKEKIHEKTKSACGTSYSKARTDKYIKSYLAEGKTIEGIYNSVVYWFDVRQSDPAKSNGSIGIVEYIYDEANEYYQKKAEIKAQQEALTDEQVNKIKEIANSGPPDRHIKRYKVMRPQNRSVFDLK